MALLYKNRCQIELFFKWIKQHLRIKKFWGETGNAVRIQIHSAITAYCMVAIAQKMMKLERSVYEVFQIVSLTFTEIYDLRNLLGKSNFNIVKDQDGSSEPTLF